jgi:ABC-type arginine/histidine transport system permease subunit
MALSAYDIVSGGYCLAWVIYIQMVTFAWSVKVSKWHICSVFRITSFLIEEHIIYTGNFSTRKLQFNLYKMELIYPEEDLKILAVFGTNAVKKVSAILAY